MLFCNATAEYSTYDIQLVVCNNHLRHLHILVTSEAKWHHFQLITTL